VCFLEEAGRGKNLYFIEKAARKRKMGNCVEAVPTHMHFCLEILSLARELLHLPRSISQSFPLDSFQDANYNDDDVYDFDDGMPAPSVCHAVITCHHHPHPPHVSSIMTPLPALHSHRGTDDVSHAVGLHPLGVRSSLA